MGGGGGGPLQMNCRVTTAFRYPMSPSFEFHIPFSKKQEVVVWNKIAMMLEMSGSGEQVRDGSYHK